MASYASELSKTQYQGNVIIRLAGNYFSIRQPDSGIVVMPQYNGILKSVVLNPTQIDIRSVSSTISTFSFGIVDRQFTVTNLIQGDANAFLEADAEIWIGRSNVGMDFSEYFKLPVTKIKKVDYADGTYSFSTTEQTDRINRTIFSQTVKLAVDILEATTSITAIGDISAFNSSGYFKLENEIISYSATDLVNKRFTGCIRGNFNTVPVAHTANNDIIYLESITGNPLDIALSVLISKGGGGAYDTLFDGCGLSQNLIDVSGIQALRDDVLPTVQFQVFLYNIKNALKWLETEILTPFNLRFSISKDSKITLNQIDRIAVRPSNSEVTESTIKSSPKWSVDGNKIVNKIEVQWDHSETIGQYLNTTVYSDAASISKFGIKNSLKYTFGAARSNLGGKAIVDKFANKLLRRLSTPTPEISVTTHIDKSAFGPVDRLQLISNQVPHYDGSLNFATELEVVSRSINHLTGDVQFRLAFVGNTLNRFGFIAPSDPILSVSSQSTINIGAGRGAYYQIGWKVRLWDSLTASYTSDEINEVLSISGDSITFKVPFDTALVGSSRYRIRFGTYTEVAPDQKRFAFINQKTAKVFSDGKPSYTITY